MNTTIIIAIISALVAVLSAILSFYSANKSFKLNHNNQAISFLNGKIAKLETVLDKLTNLESNKVDRNDFLEKGVEYMESNFTNSIETYDRYSSYLSKFRHHKKLKEQIEQTQASLTLYRIEDNPKSLLENSKMTLLTPDDIMTNLVDIPKEIRYRFDTELKSTMEYLEKIIGYTHKSK